MSLGLVPRSYYDETDSEDEVEPGALTGFQRRDSDDDEFDSPGKRPELTDGDAAPPPRKPTVEFESVSYRERAFAKKIRARIEKRGAKPSPTKAGLARSAFHDLALNVTAKTTVLDLSGQQFNDGSAGSLWTLMGESTVLQRVVLARCSVGPTDGVHIGRALVNNPGALEVLDLKRCLLDDHGLAGLLGFAPAALLCRGNLRVLDLRGNPTTAASGALLARAAQPPPPSEAHHHHGHHHGHRHGHTLAGSSPLPWSPTPTDLPKAASRTHGGGGGGGDSPSDSSGSDDDSDLGGSAKARRHLSPPPVFASRFQELSGVPTEALLAGELAVLSLGSKGLGPAEASLIGELLKTAPPSVTRLDLQWNSDFMCDGTKALSDALRHSRAPLRSLDLTGEWW